MKKSDTVMEKKAIKAPQVLNEPINYNKPVSFSRGIKINMDNNSFLFIFGTSSIDKKGRRVFSGNLSFQVKRTFKNLTALLKSEGATWRDVIKATYYLKDMRYYNVFNEK